MGTKFVKKLHEPKFQKTVIEDYLDLKSISKVAIKNNITTRQVINILNDNSIVHSTKRKIHLDEFFFKKNDDSIIGQDVMYWAGFIAADGNVMNKKESRSYFLTVNLSIKDLDHLKKMQKSLQSNAKIKIKTNKGGFRVGKQFKDTEFCSIVFNSKNLVNSLSEYGIVPNKSKIYEFPKSLTNHTFVNSFIRGYFDGDGSISIKNNRIRINFYGTQNCVDTISKIINNTCKVPLHNTYKNRSVYAIEYSGREAIQLLNWMYDKSNIYLDRKYILAQQIREKT